jgi:hypothetical protein
MKMPGFTADRSLHAARGRYRSAGVATTLAGAVVPAIPRCENCDYILDNCERNGWRPRAVCAACASGHCDSSEENPGGRCWLDPITNRRICDL